MPTHSSLGSWLLSTSIFWERSDKSLQAEAEMHRQSDKTNIIWNSWCHKWETQTTQATIEVQKNLTRVKYT